MSYPNRLLSILHKKPTDRTPFWFMRQAGRFLPEYRALRANTGGFLDLCYHPEKASEATLQPVLRFGMDAAIIFSDILVVPHALGQKVHFEEKIGPIVEKICTEEDIKRLDLERLELFLKPVYEAISLTRSLLPVETALIGFAGAPWTLACYLLEGKTTRDYANARSWALKNPILFTKLLNVLSEAVAVHLINQVRAGAEILQLFDSWSGVLSAEEFSAYSIAPAKKIIETVRKACPDVPIIAFPKGAGVKAATYAQETNINAISIDYTQPLDWVAHHLQPITAVQGNLSPLLLAYDKKAMLAQAGHIVETLGKGQFIFNLGHGIIPETPIENVEALCDYLRG